MSKNQIKKEVEKYNAIYAQIDGGMEDKQRYKKGILVSFKENDNVAFVDKYDREITISEKGIKRFHERAVEYLEGKGEVLEAMEEAMKGNENESVMLNKINATKDIYRLTEKFHQNPSSLAFSKEELFFLNKIIVAHEMAHLHFKNEYNPQTFSNKINKIRLFSREYDEDGFADVGRVRDETRADVLAIKITSEEYGNNPIFQKTLEKYNAVRLLNSLDSVVVMQHHYNLYFVSKDNYQFVKDLPNITKETLPEIEKKIEEITLKNMKTFGIEVNEEDFKKEKINKIDWLEDVVEDKREKDREFCQSFEKYDPQIFDKYFKNENECVAKRAYENKIDENKFFNKKDEEIIEKVPLTYLSLLADVQAKNEQFNQVEEIEKSDLINYNKKSIK